MTILCFAMQRLYLSDPGNIDMADTVSLLNRFASITGRRDKGGLLQMRFAPCPFHRVMNYSPSKTRCVIVSVTRSPFRVYLYQIVAVLFFLLIFP